MSFEESKKWLEDSLKQDCDRVLETGFNGGYDDMPLNAMTNVLLFLGQQLDCEKIAIRFAFLMRAMTEVSWDDPEWELYAEAYETGRDVDE